MAEKWLSTEQAAKLAGYHIERIRELLREGRIEGRKFAGVVWQVDRESLLAYVRDMQARGGKTGPKPHRPDETPQESEQSCYLDNGSNLHC